MNESYTCHICGAEIEWNGHDCNKGHIWICDLCGKPFCSSCSEKNGNALSREDEEVYCPVCD